MEVVVPLPGGAKTRQSMRAFTSAVHANQSCFCAEGETWVLAEVAPTPEAFLAAQ